MSEETITIKVNTETPNGARLARAIILMRENPGMTFGAAWDEAENVDVR